MPDRTWTEVVDFIIDENELRARHLRHPLSVRFSVTGDTAKNAFQKQKMVSEDVWPAVNSAPNRKKLKHPCRIYSLVARAENRNRLSKAPVAPLLARDEVPFSSSACPPDPLQTNRDATGLLMKTNSAGSRPRKVVGRQQNSARKLKAGLRQANQALRRVEERTAELTQASKTTKELQQFVSATLDALSAHICVLDSSGKIIFINAAYRRFAEANGAHIETVGEGANYLAVCETSRGSEAQDAFTFANGIRSVLAGTLPAFSMEYACSSPREERWFVGRVSQFANHSGRWVVVAHEDITQRKRAELDLAASQAALRASNERFAAALEASPVVLFTQDSQLRYTWIHNPALGYRPEEVVGKNDFEILERPEDAERIVSIKRGVLETGKSQRQEVSVFREGILRWYDLNVQPLHEVTAIVGIIATATDITQRKAKEETLRKQSALLDLAHDAVIVRNGDDQVIFWNPGAAETYGYTTEEALGRVTHELLQTQFPQALATIKETVTATGSWEGELTHTHKAGHQVIVTSRWALQRSEEGNVVAILEINRDITRRKKDEEALRLSEEKYRLLFTANPTPMWVFEEDSFHFLAVNEAASQQYGWSEDAFLKMRVVDLSPPEDRSATEAFISKNRGIHTKNLGTFRHSRKDGSVIDVEVTASSIVFAGVPARICLLNNVTERKRAEEALRWQAQVLAQVHDSIIVIDLTGRITSWNKGAERLYGYTAEEAVDQPIRLLYFDEDLPLLQSRVLRPVLTAGKHELELRSRAKSGEPVHINLSLSLIRNETGQPVAVVGYSLDISERKRAEEALRESEERLALALEAGRMGMWEWDLQTNQSIWNPREYQLLGLAVGDGKPPTDLFFRHVHPEDRALLDESIKEAKGAYGEWAHEFRVIRADGQVRWLAGVGAFMHGTDGVGGRMLGVNYDITERRAAEEVLARDHEKLERIVEERTAKLRELVGELEHFSYTITHDMRAPLRSMRGFAELALELCSSSVGAEQKTLLCRIINSAQRMDLLVTDALSYTRVLRQELPLGPVDLAQLLRGMLDSYPEFQESNAHITIEGDIPLVLGNEAALTQCFSNLIGNAVKFVAPGVKPEVQIFAESTQSPQPGGNPISGVTVKETFPRVRVWVIDNGIGIPDSMRPRVFNMFSRGSNDYAGTGIGLALVRKVVHRMGGRVGVESELGKGSRFWIELWPGDSRQAQIPSQPSPPADPSSIL